MIGFMYTWCVHIFLFFSSLFLFDTTDTCMICRECHGFSHGFTWDTGQGRDFCTLEKPIPSARVPGYLRCYLSHVWSLPHQPSNVTLPHHRQPPSPSKQAHCLPPTPLSACHHPLRCLKHEWRGLPHSLPATTPSVTQSASGGVCPTLCLPQPPFSACHHPLCRSKRKCWKVTVISFYILFHLLLHHHHSHYPFWDISVPFGDCLWFPIYPIHYIYDVTMLNHSQLLPQLPTESEFSIYLHYIILYLSFFMIVYLTIG